MRGAAAFAVGRGHVDGVGGSAVAEQSRQDGRATLGRVLGRLDHHHRRALPERQTAAIAIKWLRSLGRRLKRIEAGDHEATQLVGASGNDDVGVPVRHPGGGQRDRVGPGRASKLRRRYRTMRAQASRQ